MAGRRLTLTAVVVGCALLPAHASPHGGHRHGAERPFARTATTALPTSFSATASATATCPRGSRAISGGWSADPASAGLEIVQSRRVGKRSWRVSATRAGGPVSGTLTVYAYCDRDAPPAVARKKVLQSESVFTAAARCRPGEVPTAGGWRIETGGAGQSVLPLASRRVGRTWELIAHQAGFAPSEATVFAYCSPRDGRRRRKGGAALVEGPVGVARTARCPARLGARAGGFKVAYRTSASKYGISESRRVGRRWRTSAVVLAPSAPDTRFISLAYCP